jgi:hypothetical protein
VSWQGPPPPRLRGVTSPHWPPHLRSSAFICCGMVDMGGDGSTGREPCLLRSQWRFLMSMPLSMLGRLVAWIQCRRRCHMCMSSLLTMPQLRGEQQQCPEGLATVICRILVPLGLGSVPTIRSPGPDLPDIPLCRLSYVNMDVTYGLDVRRTFSIKGSCPQLTAATETVYPTPNSSPLDL